MRVWGDNAPRRGKDGTVSWTVIIPVKRLDIAKSRLRGALAGVRHDALVLAMAADTVTAALASPVVGRVVVVTDDAATSDAVVHAGADVIADVPDAGLNPALAYAAALARPMGATASLPGVAALAADLPALRAEELTEALWAADRIEPAQAAHRTAARVRGFVRDAAGSGTVLLAAPPGSPLEPCFGTDSAAAHAASGAVELVGAWPGLRRDVDTAADLREAVDLGVGARTRAVTATLSRRGNDRSGPIRGTASVTGR